MPQSFRLTIPPEELDFELTVSSGQTFRWQEGDDGAWSGVDGGNWFRVVVSEEDYFVESNAGKDEFVRLFRLEDSLVAIKREIAERGPELRPYLDAIQGLRVMRLSDPYETLFMFLCTPNNHLSRIAGMVRKLASYGNRFDEFGGHRFPPVQRIAALDEQELRALGFGYRAKSIPLAAKRLVDKPPHWLESLKDADYLSAHRELLTIPGLGPKLADCVALFGLHHMQAAPLDTHMWQAGVRLYFPEWAGRSLTDARYRQLGDFMRDRFGGLTGWAQQYLFFENLINWRRRRREQSG